MGENQYYLSGLEKLKTRNAEGAVKDFTRALDEDPGNPDIFSERGVAYFHLGLPGKALDDMNKAAELQPENPYRYASRAYIRDSLGDVDGAIADYKKAIELDPEDAIAHNNLGILEEKAMYVKSAEQRFMMADKLAREKALFNGQNAGPGPVPDHKPGEVPDKPAYREYSIVILNIFRSKAGFAEFLAFIRRGFK